jgi:UDP-2,4-diacetamido-2,4,6-trideoxy-beta-L-altropyranose hydrolase
MMHVLIRADASTVIGSGHVMRCLTIAQNLRRLGHNVAFWMDRLPGNLIDFVQEAGFAVTQQALFVDILIVDHYQLGLEWEQSMRSFASKIVVIDDLANRQHDCDLLLDQNVVANYERRYDGLVPEHCMKLLGSAYLIMREEFITAREHAIVRHGGVKRLLVFMGGSDPTGETLKVLDAVEKLQSLTETACERMSLAHIDVVVGSSNSNRLEIQRRCSELKLHYYCQINNIASLMAQADFAIGAGGSAMWERCYVGLPSSSTVVADNQRATTDKASELGAIIDLGWHEQVNSHTYLQLFKQLPMLDEQLTAISKQGLYITDSQGRTNSWLEEMVGLIP